MRFSSPEREDLRYLHDHDELVFSSLERKECPIKGSSARVARRRTHRNATEHRGDGWMIFSGLAEGWIEHTSRVLWCGFWYSGCLCVDRQLTRMSKTEEKFRNSLRACQARDIGEPLS
jgi:hypothetical protein